MKRIKRNPYYSQGPIPYPSMRRNNEPPKEATPPSISRNSVVVRLVNDAKDSAQSVSIFLIHPFRCTYAKNRLMISRYRSIAAIISSSTCILLMINCVSTRIYAENSSAQTTL